MSTLELLTLVVTKIKQNFLWLVFGGALGGTVMGYFAMQKPIVYTAYSKIFPLVQDGSSDPLSSFKSQLGISGEGSDVAKYYNVNELVKSKNLSRKIVQFPIADNSIIPIYKSIIEDQNKLNKKVFNSIPMVLSKDSMENISTAAELFTSRVDIKKEKTEFTAITTSAANPDLALRLNKVILKCLSDFYIDSRTEKARTDLQRIGHLKDSLFIALDNIEKSLAVFETTTRYKVDETVSLPEVKLQRLREEIVEQYQSTSTAYQSAKFKLMSESPIFQVLDEPTGPVARSTNSWKKSAVLGSILGVFLMLIIVLRKVFAKLLMESLKEN